MAEIVLGLAVSHSPQMSTPLDLWHLHAERDRTNPDIDFAALARDVPDWLSEHLTMESWTEKFHASERGVVKLSAILEKVAPDVVVVIGDDQKEMFKQDGMPAFAVFWGKEIMDLPHDISVLPPSIRPAYWARHGTEPEAYPVAHELALHMIKSLVEDDFDMTQLTEQPGNRSIGHAHTFIRRRLLKDKPMIPIVPVFINTFYAPNVPSPKRCYEFGCAIRRAIESWKGNERVAVIASGGLSHFVVDEEFDRAVLDAIINKDKAALTSFPKEKFVSGTSETLNWIAAAGALEGLTPEVVDYIPVYRTEARTGVGLGFMQWQ